jgi:hypothetical protein
MRLIYGTLVLRLVAEGCLEALELSTVMVSAVIGVGFLLDVVVDVSVCLEDDNMDTDVQVGTTRKDSDPVGELRTEHRRRQ